VLSTRRHQEPYRSTSERVLCCVCVCVAG
jgi:hypothetical protein